MEDKVQCPRCGTRRLHVLKRLDTIDAVYGNRLANEIRARRGDTIYHCIYCRLQFYDPRKPESKPPKLEVAAPEPESEPEPGSQTDCGTRLGARVAIVGRLEADEDVYIAGRVEGMLMSIGHQITISRGACV